MTMPKPIALLLTLLIVLSAAPALAGGQSDATFRRTEFHVMGGSASSRWQAQLQTNSQLFYQSDGQAAGSEFGSSASQEEKVSTGKSNTGQMVRAGVLSAVLPGAGQFYNGARKKAYIMGGAEVAIWVAYFVFDKQGDNRREDSEDWAAIYAGTSGDHDERYWQDVGHYSNSDLYIESLRREARALGEDYTTVGDDIVPWQWVNEERRAGYSELRAAGNSEYDKRDFMILFAVLNRTISVVDAVIGAGKDDGVLETEVMGLNLEMEVLPSFSDPGARCVVTRSF